MKAKSKTKKPSQGDICDKGELASLSRTKCIAGL